MAATLKADTLQNASSATANITLDTAGNATVGNTLAMGSSFLRNRIINGGMRIDQRNNGAAITPTGNQYSVDRFYLFMSQASKLTGQQNLDAVTPPTGYSSYLGVKIAATATVGAADCFGLAQRIEGFNCVDFSYGTSQARTLTLSFWVRSSVSGTFGGAFQNDALNRSYPFTYTISNANTWEFKTITFVGDVTGTWTTSNATGFIVEWSFGAGSNFSGTAGAWNGNNNNSATGSVSLMGTLNATWYVTGVQLEVGSVATPFERRQYGQELALCQRYYFRYVTGTQGYSNFGLGYASSATNAFILIKNPVPLRVNPSSIDLSAASTFNYNYGSSPTLVANALGIDYTVLQLTGSGMANGYGVPLFGNNNTGAYIGVSAEL